MKCSILTYVDYLCTKTAFTLKTYNNSIFIFKQHFTNYNISIETNIELTKVHNRLIKISNLLQPTSIWHFKV